MRGPLLLFFAGLLVLSSCVPNRKYLYFQKNDLNKKQKIDTVLRSYQIEKYDYKLQTNDIVHVRYLSILDKNYDFLSNTPNTQPGVAAGVGGPLLIGELIDENGEIPVPVVGRVKIAGLTIFQAQDTLQKLANKYMDVANVKVRLINFRITCLGEITRQGEINLNNNRVSLPEALGMAGGLTELADRENVKIIRQIGDQVSVQYINLLREDFVNSPYYYVHQNDVIVVPPLRQRPLRLYFTQNLALVLSSVSFILFLIALDKK